MKSYSPSVTQVLLVAHKADDYIITPKELDFTDQHASTNHETRVGYLNRLCKAGLMEKRGDPKLELYALSPYGEWVFKMCDAGWDYKDSIWSFGDVSIDDDTAQACSMSNIVPIVSDLLEK